MEILDLIKNIDKTSYIIIIAIVILLSTLLYIKRSSDIVKKIVLEVINDAEYRFNSGEGQQKLEFAVEVIRLRLPFIIKLFLTKSTLVTIIEGLLNTISHSFDLDKRVDIKGNDTLFSLKKLMVEPNIKTTDVESDIKNNSEIKQVDIDSDTCIYANIKSETDWKDNTETSVELGIKKKL